MKMKEKIESAVAKRNASDCICPRCGERKMRECKIENAYSRYADVYICSDCGTGEAMDGYFGIDAETQMNNWWIVKVV